MAVLESATPKSSLTTAELSLMGMSDKTVPRIPNRGNSDVALLYTEERTVAMDRACATSLDGTGRARSLSSVAILDFPFERSPSVFLVY